jgi:peptidoglycan/LPS O-acetylase OafA/YrhL
LKLSDTNSRLDRRYIPTLDGWRALAILLVLWAHQGNAFYKTPDAYMRRGLFYFGTWGVPVFFGLSGLLITKLLLEEQARSGRIDLRSFYIRRAFRILPPMLVCLAAITAAGLLQSGTEFWSCIFFFRNYLPWQMGEWYSGHLWSLSVEEHFYLFWPGLLVSWGARWGVWWGARRAWIPAVALSLACALWRWYLHPAASSERTDFRLDSLLLGAALAFALDSRWLARCLRPGVWMASLVLLLACIRFDWRLGSSALIPLLIAGTVIHPEWALSRALDWAPLRWLGRISYSLYLWQQIFLYPPWQPEPLVLPLGYLQRFPVSLAAALACATASYYLVERPLIRTGRRLAAA